MWSVLQWTGSIVWYVVEYLYAAEYVPISLQFNALDVEKWSLE